MERNAWILGTSCIYSISNCQHVLLCVWIGRISKGWICGLVGNCPLGLRTCCVGLVFCLVHPNGHYQIWSTLVLKVARQTAVAEENFSHVQVDDWQASSSQG